jgi:hypothetical protein
VSIFGRRSIVGRLAESRRREQTVPNPEPGNGEVMDSLPDAVRKDLLDPRALIGALPEPDPTVG